MGETTEQKFIAVVAAEFRSAANANGHDPELAEAMVDKDFEIPGIIEEGKLLSLDAENALNLGLAVGMTESVEEIMEDLGYEDYSIYRVQQNWAETVARFITNPAIAGILLMLAIGGLYLEVRTPGFGIPGMVGVTAFILAFWGHHIAGLAGLEVMLFFLLGVILLGVELFITPGFGFMGASGLVLIMASMLFMLSERMPVMDRYFTLNDLVRPMLILGSSIAGAAVLSTALLAFLPTTSMFQHLVLSDTTSREEGFSSTEKIGPELMGREGVTTSELRPAGIARFGNKRLDVVTDGSYIERGRPVKIVKVVGRRTVVKEIRG
jgi:membrane-bound serine protease (ClpP class)